jgi:wyosine [tRNA(Phe)-imidazoG37] synthetase (radical SAM superfamily)
MKNRINSGYRYIFGPVPSRRLGVSLGVDLLPAKICSLDCIYCECGKTKVLTTERKEYVPAGDVESEIGDYLSGNPDLDHITFSGSGEPTLHSGIGPLIRLLKRDHPRYRVALLTNGTLLNDPSVVKDVLDADIVKVSLDAGSVGGFVRINRPHRNLDLAQITRGLIDFRKVYSKELWIEIFVVKNINDDRNELGRIKEYVKLIEPDRIHLNTLDRPGTEPSLEAVDGNALKEMTLFFEDAQLIDGTKKIRGVQSCDIEGFITATVRRRPCTAGDISRILNIPDDEAAIRLDTLSKRGEIEKKTMPRGVFYFKPE